MLFLFILLKVCMISCQTNNDPQPPVTAPCYIGTWGNDYYSCSTDPTVLQGMGPLAQRQAQELKLVINTDSTGYFHLYDCNAQKYNDGTVRFKYSVANDKITFDWQGATADIIRASYEGFDRQTVYQIQCHGDSLIFPERLLRNDYRYYNTRYFLRR